MKGGKLSHEKRQRIPKIKITRGGYDPKKPTADPTLESWDQVARDAVMLLEDIAVSGELGNTHRSAVAKIRRRVAILDGQLEMF